MKTLMSALLIAASMSANAYDLDLTREAYNLGKLAQSRQAAATKTMTIRRTEKTPEEVSLYTQFEKGVQYCAEQGQRRVWHRGICYNECYPTSGRPVCRRVCDPDQYRIEVYCKRFAYKTVLAQETVVLDFEDAATLRAGEEEVFSITMSQRGWTSDDFNLSGAAVKAQSRYKVKQGKTLGVKRNKLKFKQD